MKSTVVKFGLGYIALFWVLSGFSPLVLLGMLGIFAITGAIAYLFANSVGLAIVSSGRTNKRRPSRNNFMRSGRYDPFGPGSINPASGLPMMGGGIDVAGNPYGTKLDD